ncbi:MAG: TIM44-like domain-containing protein [Burkholderiales bacterium]|nr:TIM44-like domain-containing protein [Burkholderiales bacterium]
MPTSIKPLRVRLDRLTRFALFAFIAAIGLALVVPDAEARRMGGGRSFGRQTQQSAPPSKPVQRDSLGQPAGQPGANQASPGTAAKPAAQAPATGNRFLGPLAGLAAGLGIAALLSHLGLMGPLAEFLAAALMIGLLMLAGLFVWRMLRGASRQGTANVGQRPLEPVYQAPAAARTQLPAASARPGSIAASLGGIGAAAASVGGERAPGVPEDFDINGFLRNAKLHFHRLQAAWDRKDVDDLNEFTTPEVLAELRVQLAEDAQDGGSNEIVELDAELLGIEEGAIDYLASVRFSGSMRSADAPAGEPFQEIWNLSKRKDGRTGWLLAGVQQVH